MKLIAAILAGGESRRMGQDKALLPIGKNSLLEFMTDKLKAAHLFEEIVICRTQRDYKQYYNEAQVKSLPDIHPGLGPVGALYTLSIHYPHHLALVAPVDMPLLKPAILEELCAAGVAHQSTYYFESYHFPLMLCLDDTTIKYLAMRLVDDNPDLSVANLLQDIKAKPLIPPTDKSQFANLNNPEDWQRFGAKISVDLNNV